MLSGLSTFFVLAAIGVAGEVLLLDRLRDSRANDWLADHVYLPALRMPALIGLVLAAYPALYGLGSGPPLNALLDFNWFGRALNILFILPLLFSLLPLAGRLSALVLPLQGMALTALLFMPLAADAGIDNPGYLATPGEAALVLVFGIGGHFLGTLVAERLPRRRLALPAYDFMVLLCQVPAILVYGNALGRQIG